MGAGALLEERRALPRRRLRFNGTGAGAARSSAMAALVQHSGTLSLDTHGKGLVDMTDETARWLAGTGVRDGLLTLFCRHTSASLLIQENAASAVRRDLARWFEAAAPEDADYEHDDEGPDDMPAHIRAALTGVSLQVPVADGRMRLGTWQGLYLFEHRRRPHRREVALHVIGA